MRRAMTARSHRYSGGRGHVAGTHEIGKVIPNQARERVVKDDLLMRGFLLERKAGGIN